MMTEFEIYEVEPMGQLSSEIYFIPPSTFNRDHDIELKAKLVAKALRELLDDE